MSASTSSPARKEFDYTILDAENCRFVQQQTDEIRGLMKRTAQGIVEIGQKLIEVKQRLGHGRFGDWLEAEFDWTWKTATRFMNVAEQFKFDNLSNLDFAPSALYELAAPSTPKTARAEAIALAEAGESITYKIAKALKQKYVKPSTKPKLKPPEPELESVSQPQPSSTPTPQSGSKLEIIAIRPRTQAPTAEIVTAEATLVRVPQPYSPVSTPDVPGVWWQLGGRHLLYCGHPNSDEFIARLPEDLQLLLAFPPARIWQSRILADACIILNDYLPVFQNPQLLDETLETLILNYSRLGGLVVTCFLPSPYILCVLNRLSRRGLLADPDSRRCNALVADWKKAGLLVERIS